MITGINHITLSVKSIAESFDFYKQVLGFRPVARWPKGAYFLAEKAWIALNVDENVRTGAPPEYSHIAFTVPLSDFETLAQRIKSSGAAIWQDNHSEGESLYFTDPNGHKLEIHASDLAGRMKTAREKPWEGLEILDGKPREERLQSSSLSMLVFSVYTGIVGAFLVFYPQISLYLGFREADTPWVRILGYVVGALSLYYYLAVREKEKNFYRWSVYGRIPLFPFFTALVLLGIAPPIMALIGAWETGLAIWTGLALRKENRSH
ncbi:MAG: VOC family protein [Armatimonadetes bacterium]|nr:VOC family protein [Armatimonadota bacterium]